MAKRVQRYKESLKYQQDFVRNLRDNNKFSECITKASYSSLRAPHHFAIFPGQFKFSIQALKIEKQKKSPKIFGTY